VKSPLAAMLPIFIVALPLFVSFTDCAALFVPTICGVKFRLAGKKVADGVPATTPEPESVAVWGLPEALSFTDNVPVLVPVTVG